MKSVLLSAFVLLCFNTSFANSTEPRIVSHKASFYLCNQTVYSYCSQTNVWGQGFGKIIIERGAERNLYDVRPWGKNSVEVAIMTGKVQALAAAESRQHPKQRFFQTSRFVATGFFGLDPIANKKVVFYLLNMEKAD